MLGLGRAGEYAGWWNTGIKSIRFAGSSAMVPLTEQSPEYSWLTNNSDQTWSCVTDGSYNLTGLTGFSGFNNLRTTYFVSYYFSSTYWPTGLTSIPQANGWTQTINVGGTTSVYNSDYNIVSNGPVYSFQWQPGIASNFNAKLILPGSYTVWRDMWITFSISSAETSSVYTNWLGGTAGTNNCAIRVCAFNTKTGAVIATSDSWQTVTAPSLNSLPSTIGTTGTNSLGINGSGESVYKTYISNWWNTFGQMFDPLSITDTSWLTPSPNATIGVAKSWTNAQYTNIVTSGSAHYGQASGQDLYSQGSNYLQNYTLDQSSNPLNFANAYSTSTIIRNN